MTLTFSTQSGSGFSEARVTGIRPIIPETDADICPVCGTFAGCGGEEDDCPRVDDE